MTRYFLLFICCFFVAAACKDNPKDKAVPTQNTEGANRLNSPQVKAFAGLYPTAQEVFWDTLDEHTFSATFFDGSFQNVAYFDGIGRFQFTTTYIEAVDLPKTIQKILNDKYRKATTAVILRVENGTKRSYQIELQTNTDYINLEFDESGKLLKEKKAPLSTDELKQQEEEGVEN